MPKSPDAFRTISEVADWLGIQAHVLRFWESKFTQVKPIKRAGGRRYYRPADMLLLGGIRKLLHEDGLTIKGVQKILREEGMSHVAAMSMPLDDEDEGSTVQATVAPTPTERKTPEPEEAVVLPFEAPKEPERAEPEATVEDAVAKDAAPAAEPPEEAVKTDTDQAEDAHTLDSDETNAVQDVVKAEPAGPIDAVTEDKTAADEPAPQASADTKEPEADTPTEVEPILKEPDEALSDSEDAEVAETMDDPAPAAVTAKEDEAQSAAPTEDTSAAQSSDALPDESQSIAAQNTPDLTEADTPAPAADEDAAVPSATEPEERAASPANEAPAAEETTEKPVEPAKEASAPLPAFLRRPAAAPLAAESTEKAAPVDAGPADSEPVPKDVEKLEPVAEASQPQEAPSPKARDIGMPPVTPEAEIHAETAALSRSCQITRMDKTTAAQVTPLLAQLSALRDRMAARAGGSHPNS